eukprot:TRINITY_DN4117_c0_g1_i1.p1 TRINITY_DN4117_c0_g1~~TRINITY_DN4117_c0_g1_i1.p1  ORF type:complete len:746 (-),score=162.51 TRINITY_DN4117_c0_g1_i1:23-2260(-)
MLLALPALVAVLAPAVAQEREWAVPCLPPLHNGYAFCNVSLPLEQRVDALLAELTLDEKAALMGSSVLTPAGPIDRLGIPRYNWWSEVLHGVASTCVSEIEDGPKRCPTSFPSPLNGAATFNDELVRTMAEQISEEARALRRFGAWVVYYIGDINDKVPLPIGPLGLDAWSPNINLFRDPRWGRGQETPGEDPVLTGRYAVQFVRGLQEGNDTRYIKLGANLKHFHSYSLESYQGVDRHSFDARVSEQDLHQSFYPHFAAGVRGGNPLGMMCSYNRINGVPGCAGTWLDLARESWGFQGYITSDCGGIGDFFRDGGHGYVETAPEATAAALQAGCDLDCGLIYDQFIVPAVEQGLLSEAVVDTALRNLVSAQMRLGWYDPPAEQPYNSVAFSVIDSEEHRSHAAQIARESIVLLKNNPVNGSSLLPISANARVALIGPHANATDMLCSNYRGTLPHVVSLLEALEPRVALDYHYGCDIDSNDRSGFAAAVAAAAASDVAVVVMGIDQTIEREGRDRESLGLPGVQEALLREIFAAQPRTVLVLVNGGAVSIDWAAINIPAIIEAFYPGEEGGTAMADAIMGRYNPSGRLPVTIYPAAYAEQVSFFSFDMRAGPGRTYRFYKETPLFEFGYGLSYTTFRYQIIESSERFVKGVASVVVDVQNAGEVAGDVSVLAFLQHNEQSGILCPIKQLVSYEKVYGVEPGAIRRVAFEFGPEDALCVDETGNLLSLPGTYTLFVGDTEAVFEL